MNWRSVSLWFGALAITGLLYGAWAQRTRSLLAKPVRPAVDMPSDEELARYLNDGVGKKSKIGCEACSPQQEKLMLSTLRWASQVLAQEKARRQ